MSAYLTPRNVGDCLSIIQSNYLSSEGDIFETKVKYVTSCDQQVSDWLIEHGARRAAMTVLFAGRAAV